MSEAGAKLPIRAVVVGASGGIGGALAETLASRGATVHVLARTPPPPRDNWLPGTIDITDEGSVAAAFAMLGSGAPLDLVVVASGLLHDAAMQPEKSLRALDPAILARAFATNAIGPALVIKHALPLMPRRSRGVFAALSARVGSIADNRLGGWYGYRASKAALNQLVRTAAVEAARTHPAAILVALHPGTVATGLSAPFRGGSDTANAVDPATAAANLLGVIDGLTPTDTGGFFGWDGQPIPF